MLKQVLKIAGRNQSSSKSGSMPGGGEGTLSLLERGANLLIWGLQFGSGQIIWGLKIRGPKCTICVMIYLSFLSCG